MPQNNPDKLINLRELSAIADSSFLFIGKKKYNKYDMKKIF